MDIEDQFDHLLSSGVLSFTGEDDLRLSEEYLDSYRNLKDAVRAGDVDLDSSAGVEDFELETFVEPHEEYVCHVLALRERSPSLDSNAVLTISFLLCNLDSLTPDDDSPSSFLPVSADQIDLASEIFDRLIVYVWTDDCQPCEIMEERFRETVHDGLGEVIPLSVYGPDDPRHLQREYDIGVAPTFVFIKNGLILERTVGARSKAEFEGSIEQLRDD